MSYKPSFGHYLQMRITSITHARDACDDGLAPISMHGLKRIVVLAGANGSGKSRFLARVKHGADPYQQDNALGKGFTLENPILGYAPVEFVCKNLKLHDPAEQAPQTVDKWAAQAECPGASNLSRATLAYIGRVHTHWWNSSHQSSEEPEFDRKKKRERYESLCSLIKTVLGEPLKRDSDNNATLFGKTIANAKLSDGQRALLQWSVALHAQGTELSTLVLLMDEPENHLHAESLVSSVDRIVNANSDGQIWIATHSVPLIASLYKNYPEDLSIYFMHEGAASFASERPEIVLNSLMGGEKNIESLREFIDLPEVFATNRFAAQCLQLPDVVADDNPNDPQVQLANAEADATGQPMSLLDYGCGKGRFLSSLASLHGSELPNRFNYVGWDRYKSNQLSCEHVIQTSYGSAAGRWYCDRNDLMEHYPAGSFDSVLLCNVLHEIPPNEWVATFDEGSIINQSLSNSGRVLLIEDYLMPKGEYAHPFGCIVLDTEALQKLFGVIKKGPQLRVETERDGRIKSHVIPKQLLCNVSHVTVRESLKLAQRNAREKIEELRAKDNPDFKSGRAHGFWVQQFANASLALS